MKTENILFSVRTRSRGSDIGLLLMRIVLACLMMTHGFAKIYNFEALSMSFPNPIGWGSQLSLILIILAEVGCSLLLLIGLCTRLAAIPLMFGMIVAAFVQHAGDPFAARELSVLYLCMYLVLFILGPGHYSIDSVIQSQILKSKREKR
ncbi:DoxX family protein [Bacteroidales bacterium OttesenSCG-928-J16]|nr:DoxX family protein [Bacteroidales bacterium OttesenSCG-928-J16]